MSWTARLEEAKGLLEKGLISQEEFEVIRQSAVQEMTSAIPNKISSIGAYRIIDTLGEGGMGVVYRGVHINETISNRQGGEVAIKVLHPQYAKNPEFRARFDKEASLGFKLNHEGIVNAIDLIEDNEQLALVMELVEGVPLSDKIGQETGPFYVA